MKLTVPGQPEPVDTLMVDIENLCAGIDLALDPDNHSDITRLTTIECDTDDDWQVKVLDLADVIDEHGMSDAIASLFEDDATMVSIFGEKNVDGAYDNSKIVTDLMTMVAKPPIEQKGASFRSSLLRMLMWGYWTPLYNKWADDSVRVLARMKEVYDNVLSKPEDQVIKLMDVRITSVTRDALSGMLTGLNDLSRIIPDIPKKPVLDMPVAAIQSAVKKTGYDVAVDTDGKIAATPALEKATFVGTLADAGWTYSNFVMAYRDTMKLVAAAINVMEVLKKVSEASKAQITDAKRDIDLSKDEYKKRKKEIKLRQQIAKHTIAFYTKLVKQLGIGMHSIGKRAKLSK